eukprot:1756391-Amphidinium_carterae.1
MGCILVSLLSLLSLFLCNIWASNIISSVQGMLYGVAYPTRSATHIQRARWGGRRRLVQRITRVQRRLETMQVHGASVDWYAQRGHTSKSLSRSYSKRKFCTGKIIDNSEIEPNKRKFCTGKIIDNSEVEPNKCKFCTGKIIDNSEVEPNKRKFCTGKVIDSGEIEESLAMALSPTEYASTPNAGEGVDIRKPRQPSPSGSIARGARRLLRLDRHLRSATSSRQVRHVLRAQTHLERKGYQLCASECYLRVRLLATPHPLRMLVSRHELTNCDACPSPSEIERALFEHYQIALARYDRISVVESDSMLQHNCGIPARLSNSVLKIVPDVRVGSNLNLPADYPEVANRVVQAVHGTIKASAVRLLLRGDLSVYRKVACTQDAKLINNIMQAAARRYT